MAIAKFLLVNLSFGRFHFIFSRLEHLRQLGYCAPSIQLELDKFHQLGEENLFTETEF